MQNPTFRSNNQVASGGSTPTIASGHALQSNCSTGTCNLNFTMPSGTTALLVEYVWNQATGSISSISDCAGSSTCGATTDTLSTGQAITTVAAAYQGGSYYICNSALSSGASNVSIVLSGNVGTFIYEVYPIQGAPTSSCYDTGSVTGSGSGTPSSSTSGNITTSSDLVVALGNPTGTASAGAGYTSVDNNTGNKMAESANTAPASGSPATATMGGSNGGWVFVIDAIK